MFVTSLILVMDNCFGMLIKIKRYKEKMYTQQSAMNDFLKELQDLGGKVFTTSRTPMSQSDDDLIEDIKNDPNRIVIKETIKSPQFGHFSEFQPH